MLSNPSFSGGACEKGALKNFPKFPRKQLRQSAFLIKLLALPAT